MRRIDAKARQQQGQILRSPYRQEISPESLPPYFSLRYLSGDYCLSLCTRDEKAAFADTLHRLSKLTWAQIKSSPRHGLGCEKIERYEIRTGIPSHITEDVNIIAFRFSGLKPMVGYRDRATFYVLWLDRDSTLYDHG